MLGLMGSDKSGGLESLGTLSQASVFAPNIFFFFFNLFFLLISVTVVFYFY